MESLYPTPCPVCNGTGMLHLPRSIEETVPVVCRGDLQIDINNRRVWVAQREIFLRRLEHRLLMYLALNAQRIVTTNQAISYIWEEDDIEGDMPSRIHALRSTVGRLRDALGDENGHPRHILTHKGIGYSLAPEG